MTGGQAGAGPVKGWSPLVSALRRKHIGSIPLMIMSVGAPPTPLTQHMHLGEEGCRTMASGLPSCAPQPALTSAMMLCSTMMLCCSVSETNITHTVTLALVDTVGPSVTLCHV